MKRWRQRIALIERLRNTAARLAQPGIVKSHADQALRAILQSPFYDVPEQLLGLPATARMEEILRAPTTVLTAVSPDNAGQTTAADADQ